jgi:transcription termination factor NusB
MIARLSTKILAMQVKLHDPDIVNNSTLTNKINKDIAYYRQLLQGIVAERNRLADELKYGHFEDNGSFHFDVPNGGLVPGLTPPENNQTGHQQTAQQNFEEMEEKYNANYGNYTHLSDPKQITMLNEMIAYVSEMLDAHEPPGVNYWQGKLEYWQNKLEQLQNNG